MMISEVFLNVVMPRMITAVRGDGQTIAIADLRCST
jgi:hypothetical protein